MKKVVALLLVLGIASAASATFQISVHPDQQNPLNDYQVTWDPMNPEDSTIVLKPSQTVILDIHTDADIAFFGGETWALVVETARGAITGGDPLYMGNGYTNVVQGATQDNDEVIPPQGMEGIWGISKNFNPTLVVDGGATLVDGILFHCEGPGDATVKLYAIASGQEFSEANLLDSVLIHQIPEPMTLGLLGLGGLGLIRRRRS